MKETLMFSNFLQQCFNTLIAALIVTSICVIYYRFVKKKISNKKQVLRIRSRAIYISVLTFIFMIINIWIEGFYHLLTMLSLVAAGLVIVNKENIMNFSGWIIINWRGLFSEGDPIQVQSFIGEVIGIKLLYFTIRETYYLGDQKPTGKIIKVPNSLIITNPISIFSCDDDILLYKSPFLLNIDHNTLQTVEQTRKFMSSKIKSKYLLDDSFSNDNIFSIKQLNKIGIHNLEPKIEFAFLAESEKVIQVKIGFYCLAKDSKSLEQDMMKFLIDLRTNNI